VIDAGAIEGFAAELKLVPFEVRRAIVMGINQSLAQIQRLAAEDIATYLDAKRPVIDRRTRRKLARANDMTAVISILTDVYAILLNPRQTMAGVEVAGELNRGAFIQRTKVGKLKYHVFKRKDKRRYPILRQTYNILDVAKGTYAALEGSFDKIIEKNVMSKMKFLAEQKAERRSRR
jgi:hypothetical protein